MTRELYEYIIDGCKELELDSGVYRTHDDIPFFIAQDWKEVRKLEAYLRKILPAEILEDIRLTDGDYAEDCINYCMNNKWGFSDEYDTCYDCSKVIRTSPDSYSWMPDYYKDYMGYIHCSECFKDYHEDYIQELIDNPRKCNQLLTDEQLKDLGFIKLNRDSYQSGLHTGMNDNPNIIYETLKSKHIEDIVFSQSMQSQFYIEFDVWARGANAENLNGSKLLEV